MKPLPIQNEVDAEKQKQLTKRKPERLTRGGMEE
jgi:hypothetical protein